MRDYFVEEQRNLTISEEKSEINLQESRAGRADCAIRDLNRQVHSHRMEIYHTNQVVTKRTSLAPSRTGNLRKSSPRCSY